MRRCHLEAVLVYFMVLSFRPSSSSCYNMHTVLESLPLRAVIGKLSWGSFWAFQWCKGLTLLRRQATDRWELSHVIRTLARSIASLSARLRSIVVSPEHPLSRPCHLKPDREVRWAWNTDKNHVVRRLPAVPIFRRPVETHLRPTHHQRKWRRGPKTRPDRGECGGGSVSVPMSWLHEQIATVHWAAAPATSPWHGTVGFPAQIGVVPLPTRHDA